MSVRTLASKFLLPPPQQTFFFQASKGQVHFVVLPDEISETVNDRAIDFFLSTHIFRDSDPIRGYYEYLFIYRNDPKTIITFLQLSLLSHSQHIPMLSSIPNFSKKQTNYLFTHYASSILHYRPLKTRLKILLSYSWSYSTLLGYSHAKR